MKNCKFCNAEMEDEQTVCPACGKEETEEVTEVTEAAEQEEVTEEAGAVEQGAVTEEAEAVTQEETAETAAPTAEKVSPARRVGAWVLLGLFALALVFTALIFLSAPKNVDPAATQWVTIQDSERNFTAENTEHMEDVVATCEKAPTGNAFIDGLHKLGIGAKKEKLTNATLALFYWDSFYSIYNQNAYYLSLMGMDPAAMENSKTESGQTWQEYFLSIALDHFREQTAVRFKAKSDGFALPSDYAENLAAMREELENMEDIEQQLQNIYGAGITLEDYLAYVEGGYYFNAYLDQCRDKIEISDAELDVFYAEHKEEYEQMGLQTVDKNVVSVRHILIRPEDAADEASWTAAQTKANEIYQEWQNGEKTEQSFAALASEHSEDNAANGGLYEGVYPGQMVAAFNDWCFADGRVSGDSGVVRTEYGFHIMYFVGEGDTIYWRDVVRQNMEIERVYDMVDELKAQYALNYDLDAITIPLPEAIAGQSQSQETDEQPQQPQDADTAPQDAELQPEQYVETVSEDELADMGFDVESEQTPAASAGIEDGSAQPAA
ncbi:MAG: peptidylprolyl isomerase [Oscillospiraceae bacterium]|nr:peptidylprolyl isomerase [Oscillospiraceae bacterium]